MSRRMRAAEEDMPSLPLPPLPATLAALKRSIRAVATDEEYAHSEAVIDEFAGGAGPDLHAALEERASSMRNW
ncbi:hypothetical protein EON66_00120 [archaeon]|nr:MAG: hypothetical protein EON66_00120 [archaeon]